MASIPFVAVQKDSPMIIPIMSDLHRYPRGERDLHVVPYNQNHLEWAVKAEPYDDYLKVFHTQEQAIEYAVYQAKAAASMVLVHGVNGRIREVWDYYKPVKLLGSFV